MKLPLSEQLRQIPDDIRIGISTKNAIGCNDTTWISVGALCHEAAEALAKQEQGEPVTTDWERIARVQNAKLMAMSDTVGGFEKLREVLDKYEATTPQPRKPLTDEQIYQIASAVRKADTPESVLIRLARAIEFAHGIKE